MKSPFSRILAALCLAGAAAAATAAGAARFTPPADVPLDQVPQVVLDAAASAVPGISLGRASLRTGRPGVVFKLGGIAAGRQYELKVDATRRVLTTKPDDDDHPATGPATTNPAARAPRGLHAGAFPLTVPQPRPQRRSNTSRCLKAPAPQMPCPARMPRPARRYRT